MYLASSAHKRVGWDANPSFPMRSDYAGIGIPAYWLCPQAIPLF